MSGNQKNKIAFSYFGGKFTWLEHLYENFPAGFTHLIDLFAGSMVVSINYPGKIIRTANEINGEVTNFFLQLRDHEEELLRLLRLTPCSKQEYLNCRGGLRKSPTSNGHGSSMSGCVSHSMPWEHRTKTKAGRWHGRT